MASFEFDGSGVERAADDARIDARRNRAFQLCKSSTLRAPPLAVMALRPGCDRVERVDIVAFAHPSRRSR